MRRNSEPEIENFPTDKLFTGQRLDGTGLYYYGARYYDPTIGRFISPDTIVPDPAVPQSFNRYTYCLNNPLKYSDPSGQTVYIGGQDASDLNALAEFCQDWGIPVPEPISDAICSEYDAWEDFIQEYPERAFELEILKENVYLEYADLGFGVDSTYDIINDETHIILNNNENNDISKVNSFYRNGQIYYQSYEAIPVFTEQELQNIWIGIQVGGGIALTALGGALMGEFFGLYVVQGLEKIAAGALVYGSYDVYSGIIYTGISAKVFLKGIEIGSLGYWQFPNYWWPLPPYLQP